MSRWLVIVKMLHNFGRIQGGWRGRGRYGRYRGGSCRCEISSRAANFGIRVLLHKTVKFVLWFILPKIGFWINGCYGRGRWGSGGLEFQSIQKTSGWIWAISSAILAVLGIYVMGRSGIFSMMVRMAHYSGKGWFMPGISRYGSKPGHVVHRGWVSHAVPGRIGTSWSWGGRRIQWI